MSTYTLYGFLEDDALIKVAGLDLENASDQGFGVLRGEARNYFVERGSLQDIRLSRLEILNSKIPYGAMRLLFDAKREDELNILKLATEDDLRYIFNIMERIYLQQEYTHDNLEHLLVNSGEFRGYVPNSFMYSPVETNDIAVRNIEKGYKAVTFKNWYSFDYESATMKIKFHFWISNKAFASEYPYVTITDVIPPYEVSTLLNPSLLVQEGGLKVLQDGSSFVFSNVNEETRLQDQNGVYTYSTKYILDGTTTLSLPFALPYCGASVPTSLDCRKAIREYFEKETTLSQEHLESLFPELYINSRFYIVPLWDVFTFRADRDVYNSVNSIKTILAKMRIVFKDTDIAFVDEHVEILSNAQNKMLSLSLADELNADIFSIKEQHPTYQDYSSQVPGWKYLEVDTQEFAGKLIRCFAALNGEIITEEFITTTISNSTYLSFVSGKSEYLVMTKDSYETLMANI